MIAYRLPGRAGAGRSRAVLCAFVMAIALAASACDKVPLLAPRGSTITLSASSTVLPINGSTEIIATVTEAPGTPVQNGTLVTFTTTLGTIEPREARTHNGQVTVRLNVGNQSGTAEVRAFSGNAASPTGTSALTIRVGGAGAETVQVNVSPTNLPFGGGNVQVTAIVRDVAGNALPGAPVSFATDAGSFTVNPVVTDANGQARTTLNTPVTASVTATVAGKTSSAVRVTVGDRPGAITVAITAPQTITEDQPAAFSFAITSGTNAPRVTNLRVDWGDGTFSNLGQVGGTASTTHTYAEDGPYVVVATVLDEGGGQSSASTQVFVQEAPSIPVTVTVGACQGADGCNPGEPVTFTANATAPTGATISRYLWEWGDGTSEETTGNIATHTYEDPDTYTVVVTAFATNGSSGRGQTQVQIVRGTVSVTASFSCPGGTCEAGEQVTFTATATPSAGTTITSYQWTFGDGSSAQGRQVSHSYGSPGSYPVTVTVTASNGNRGSDTISVGVNP